MANRLFFSVEVVRVPLGYYAFAPPDATFRVVVNWEDGRGGYRDAAGLFDGPGAAAWLATQIGLAAQTCTDFCAPKDPAT